MATADELKAEIKRLSSQATALKMDLHDLAEDLPLGWERILEVAGKTHETYEKLAAAKSELTRAG